MHLTWPIFKKFTYVSVCVCVYMMYTYVYMYVRVYVCVTKCIYARYIPVCRCLPIPEDGVRVSETGVTGVF